MNINWRDWDLIVSASQIETWDSCNRKWWLSKCHKMPELDKGFQIYGNVIHGVAERFFAADDLGYDRVTKKPVELYPEGWEISYDRVDKKKALGKIDLQQQAQIKLLVRRAIDEGIWTRRPGRVVEAEFLRPVIDRIAMIGYIDLILPDEVHDHKSTKNMNYAKSSKDLETNTQLLIYAKEVIWRALEQGRKLTKVVVRHNTFSKDPKNPVVRAVSADVSAEAVEHFWQQVQAKAGAMRTLKRAGIPVESWSGVRGPASTDTCNDYGGCAFRGICGKVETPQAYRARIELAQKAQQEGATTLTSTGPTTMGIFDKMKTTTSGAPTASAPTPPPAQTAKVATQAPAAPAKEELQQRTLHPNQVAAPWGRPGCKACAGKGLTTKGMPCRVCDTFNRKEGKPTSDAWKLSTTPDGMIVWTDAAGAQGATPAVLEPKVSDQTTAAHAPAAAPAAAPATEPKKSRRTRLDKTAEAPATSTAQAAPASTPEVAPEETPEVEEEVVETEKGKPGRRPQGFTLLINALPERAKTTGVIGLDQEFERWGAELAKDMGAESFFALDAYKRRDWLAMRAKQISETFGSKIVTAVGHSPDFLEFLSAIKPYASYVYVGTR